MEHVGIPLKKRKFDKDVAVTAECCICGESSPKLVENVKDTNVKRMLESLKERDEAGDKKFYDCYKKLSSCDVTQLKELGISYHSNCYKSVTNKTNIERIKRNFEDHGKPYKRQQEKFEEGTLDNSAPEESQGIDTRSLRSSTSPYDKHSCIICQIPGGKLHKASFKETGIKMLKMAENLPDKEFFIRLNSVPNAADAVANDVQYHLVCWVNLQRASSISSHETIQHCDDLQRIIADIEILNIVKTIGKANSGNFIDMNTLNNFYNDMLGHEEKFYKNYKKYLKAIITENIKNVQVSRPKTSREPAIICSNSSRDHAIDQFINTPDEYSELFAAASLVRRSILQKNRWTFTGDYFNDYIPLPLSQLLQWIIIGPKDITDFNKEKKNTLDVAIQTISEIIIKATKTKKQVNNDRSNTFHETIETPFTTGLGLYIHQQTRSKKLIDTLSNLNLTIPYDKVLKYETGIANSISENIESNNGVYVPPNIIADVPLHFAIDNVDFRNDTPDGKNEFHGVGQVVFQPQEVVQKNEKTIIHIPSFKASDKVSYSKNVLSTIEGYKNPSPPNDILDFSKDILCEKLDTYKKMDLIWTVSSAIKHSNMPTWNAYNSLFSDSKEPTTIQFLPLYQGPPTDFSNLFSALKRVQGIAAHTIKDFKTIVTLDLQLYDKCMQMCDDKYIKENFVFRLGELHIVFAMLKVIGKYICDSGLELLFTEAGIYGPTTLGQILEGKHLKRCTEAYFTLYLALSTVLFENIFENETDEWEAAKLQIIKSSNEFLGMQSREDNLRLNNEIAEHLKNLNFFTKLDKFSSDLQNQGKYLFNFMKMFQTMILFIRASRDGDWALHLASLLDFAKFFFAHDQLNYARMTPLYLANMTNLQESDKKTWMYLEKNFTVFKSRLPFVGIGTDHALEQENKLMKVAGGVVGLTQNHTALNRFCLSAPVLSSLSQQFLEKSGVKSVKRKQHYEFQSKSAFRLHTNTELIVNYLNNLEVSFLESSDVYNIVTKAVLPKEISSELLQHEAIGETMLTKFVHERIQGNVSVWEHMKKCSLKTFKSTRKSLKSISNGKEITIKEEKNLMARFLIAARKRPELDLEKCIGCYEFSVVPRSLFCADGQPLPCTDKSKLLHCIEELADAASDVTNQSNHSCIVIDGMAVVNEIFKDDHMKTCKNFAEKFIERIGHITRSFAECRLLFDQYKEESLKSTTRKRRTSGVHIRYQVNDSTNIQRVNLKQFLSHVLTKQQLTIYLAGYAKEYFEKEGKKYVVSYSNKCNSNIDTFEVEEHDHEEGDTMIILHLADVAKSDPFAESVVYSSDTDVFLLLVHHYQKLPQVTLLRTGKRDNKRDIDIGKCFEALGPKRSSGLVGFHALTGCDQIGRFNGKSKASCWKTYMASPDHILTAFSELGNNENLPGPSTLENLEEFVCLLYQKDSGKKTVAEVRWYMFSKFQSNAENMPPTFEALKHKVFRAHFMSIVWKRAIQPFQNLPSFLGFGWEKVGEIVNPILTDDLPAPISLLEISSCSCKLDCATKRCKCRRNNFFCTDMCKCNNCVNNDCWNSNENDELIDGINDENLNE